MKNVLRKNEDVSTVIFRTHSSKKKAEFTVGVSGLSLNIIIGTPMKHNLKIYWFCKTENIFRNNRPCCSRGVCLFWLFLLKWRKNSFTSSIYIKNKNFTSDQSRRKLENITSINQSVFRAETLRTCQERENMQSAPIAGKHAARAKNEVTCDLLQ